MRRKSLTKDPPRHGLGRLLTHTDFLIQNRQYSIVIRLLASNFRIIIQYNHILLILKKETQLTGRGLDLARETELIR